MAKLTRRQALKTLAGSSLIPAATALPFGLLLEQALAEEKTQRTFLYGVASGDPTQSSVVLWTRLNDESVKGRSERVRWELATDPGFENVLQKGKVKSQRDSDFSVKVLVEDLEPGQTYYYRFEADDVYSEPGRTKTLPVGHLEKLGIALASCSNYPFGYFNAYDAMADDEQIDFVIHLGDYIYEYGTDSYGGETGKQLGRDHFPSHETVTLEDYRLRHAQYKSDLGSRRLHAAHPIIVIWDDHESANNPYVDGAQNHQPDEGDWDQRRADSLQAYYEWMPIRDPAKPEARMALWRHFEFGDLATLTTLETRHTGRSKQIEYDDYLDGIQSREDRDAFVSEVLGDPSRTMLSDNMTQFLERSLKDSVQKKVPWRLIGNQIPMARTHVPVVSESFMGSLSIPDNAYLQKHVKTFQKLGQWDLPIYTDTWDGYPVARERFYDSCADSGATDLLVLTGDSHAYWFNQLHRADKTPMGFEIGTTGITSPGDFESFAGDQAKTLDAMMAQKNAEILWTDNVSKGYVRLDVNPEQVAVNYVAVTNILSPEYEVVTRRQYQVTRNGATLNAKRSL